MSFRHKAMIRHRRLKKMGFGENRRIRRANARGNVARAWMLGANRDYRLIRRK